MQIIYHPSQGWLENICLEGTLLLVHSRYPVIITIPLKSLILQDPVVCDYFRTSAYFKGDNIYMIVAAKPDCF
jgi:hypothetical protein